MITHTGVETVSVVEHGVLPILSVKDESIDALLKATNGFTARWTSSGRKVYAANLVGLAAIDERTIVEVLPKTTSDGFTERELTRSRQILSAMICEWMGIPQSPEGTVEIASVPQAPLFDILIARFLSTVDRLLSGGLRFGYRNTMEARTALRGRIVWAEHLRQERGVAAEIVCEFDDYTPNRPENRLARWAVRTAGKYAQAEDLRRKSIELAERFFDVPQTDDPRADFRRWTRDRNMRHYEALRPWIKLLIEFAAPGGTLGVHRLPSLLFPMEKLFENWVANRITAVGHRYGWRTVRQSSRFYLSSWGTKNRFQLIPDLILYHPTEAPIVLDTKWKLVDALAPDYDGNAETRTVSQSDMYQMNAYLETVHDKQGVSPTDGFLLYPDHLRFPPELSSFPFVLGNGKRVWAIPVPLETEGWEKPTEIESRLVLPTVLFDS